jgi:hypothetical protein
MLRTIISFAAGFVVAGLVAEAGSVKKFKTVAKEKAARLKSAGQKAVAAAREELRNKEVDEAGAKM